MMDGLKRMGMDEGMQPEVHCPLSKFGHVDGGAETLISALQECCGKNGSIFMPALRLSPELEGEYINKILG